MLFREEEGGAPAAVETAGEKREEENLHDWGAVDRLALDELKNSLAL
ncbi:hypothetical protein NSPZN2_40684 [Nitrospira defluvii]|uniref:Uncharacterized protein n=1 Tax=Nitrospira defluvii TaxID=330214 RepID=A0ABN7M0Z3_9BACT|nr:hypothetical protein NSPZN2_40684 [Nitrospira defluvii]